MYFCQIVKFYAKYMTCFLHCMYLCTYLSILGACIWYTAQQGLINSLKKCLMTFSFFFFLLGYFSDQISKKAIIKYHTTNWIFFLMTDFFFCRLGQLLLPPPMMRSCRPTSSLPKFLFRFNIKRTFVRKYFGKQYSNESPGTKSERFTCNFAVQKRFFFRFFFLKDQRALP